jgi:hypothetical protein
VGKHTNFRNIFTYSWYVLNILILAKWEKRVAKAKIYYFGHVLKLIVELADAVVVEISCVFSVVS